LDVLDKMIDSINKKIGGITHTSGYIFKPMDYEEFWPKKYNKKSKTLKNDVKLDFTLVLGNMKKKIEGLKDKINKQDVIMNEKAKEINDKNIEIGNLDERIINMNKENVKIHEDIDEINDKYQLKLTYDLEELEEIEEKIVKKNEREKKKNKITELNKEEIDKLKEDIIKSEGKEEIIKSNNKKLGEIKENTKKNEEELEELHRVDEVLREDEKMINDTLEDDKKIRDEKEMEINEINIKQYIDVQMMNIDIDDEVIYGNDIIVEIREIKYDKFDYDKSKKKLEIYDNLKIKLEDNSKNVELREEIKNINIKKMENIKKKKKINKRIGELKKDIDKKEEKLNTLKEDNKKIDIKMIEKYNINETIMTKKTITEIIKEMNDDITEKEYNECKTKEEEYDKISGNIEEKEEEICKMKDENMELEDMKFNPECEECKKNKIILKKRYIDKKDQLKNKIGKLKEKQKEIDITEIKKQIKRYNKKIEYLKMIRYIYEDNNNRIGKLETKISEIKKDIKYEEQNIVNIDEKIKENEEEINNNNKKLDKITEEKKNIKDEMDDINYKKEENIMKQYDMKIKLINKLRVYEADIKDEYNEVINEITKYTNDILIVKNDIEVNNKNIKRIEEEIDYDKEDRSDLEKNITKLKKELKEMNKKNKDYEIKVKIYNEMEKEKTINEIIKKMKENNTKDKKKYKEKIDKLHDENEEDNKNLIKLRVEQDELNKKLGELNMKYEAGINMKDNLEDCDEDKQEYNILKDSISVDEIFKTKILPKLSEVVNEKIQNLGYEGLEFTTISKGKGMGVEIKKSSGVSVNTLSGYESQIYNILIKISIAEISLTKRFNFMIIDEVFDSADMINKEKVFTVINMIKENYDWFLTISHDDDIKDYCNDEQLRISEGKEGKILSVV